MTSTLLARTMSTALDAADSVVTVTAAAAVGLTTYRTQTARPAETRITLAIAAGVCAALLAEKTTYRLLAPLRRRTAAAQQPKAEAIPLPTPRQLALDVAADAPHRAAFGAGFLDHGNGSLTKAANWTGRTDGTATCAITRTTHLLAVPNPSTSAIGRTYAYLLVQDDHQPVPIHSISDLVALLDQPTDASLTGTEQDNAPEATIGQSLAIAELRPAGHSAANDHEDPDPATAAG